MKVIKLSRAELLEILINSWRNHYAVCDNEYLAKEYEQEFDDDVTIIVTEDKTKGQHEKHG
jgi:hypothetical protein